MPQQGLGQANHLKDLHYRQGRALPGGHRQRPGRGVLRRGARGEREPGVRRSQQGARPGPRHPHQQQRHGLQHPLRQQHGVPQEHGVAQLPADPRQVQARRGRDLSLALVFLLTVFLHRRLFVEHPKIYLLHIYCLY